MEEDIREQRAQALIRLRERQLLSRHQLAKKADITPNALYALEDGRSEIRLSTVGKLAQALGVHHEVLLYPAEHVEEIYGRTR